VQGRVKVYVPPSDIVVSKKAFNSSGRNTFKGQIVEIQKYDSSVKLVVDAGPHFSVLITDASRCEMGLEFGSEVFLTFKATAVRVLKAAG